MKDERRMNERLEEKENNMRSIRTKSKRERIKLENEN